MRLGKSSEMGSKHQHREKYMYHTCSVSPCTMYIVLYCKITCHVEREREKEKEKEKEIERKENWKRKHQISFYLSLLMFHFRLLRCCGPTSEHPGGKTPQNFWAASSSALSERLPAESVSCFQNTFEPQVYRL